MLAGRDGRATVVLGVRPLRCERIDWEVEADMDDPQIHGAIEELVAEEHELWQREAAGAPTGCDSRRSGSRSISAGISCASGERGATQPRTRIPPRLARPTSSSGTSSSKPEARSEDLDSLVSERVL
jgi:hypothetical protein